MNTFEDAKETENPLDSLWDKIQTDLDTIDRLHERVKRLRVALLTDSPKEVQDYFLDSASVDPVSRGSVPRVRSFQDVIDKAKTHKAEKDYNEKRRADMQAQINGMGQYGNILGQQISQNYQSAMYNEAQQRAAGSQQAIIGGNWSGEIVKLVY